MATIKKAESNKSRAGKAVEKWEPLCSVSANVKRCSCCGKQHGGTPKMKQNHIIRQFHTIYTPKPESSILKSYLCIHVVSAPVVRTETASTSSVHGQTSGETECGACTQWGILSLQGWRKEIQTPATTRNMEEPWGQCAKWNKPVNKKTSMIWFHPWDP